MMSGAGKKMGAAGTAPGVRTDGDGDGGTYTLPFRYRKPIRFDVEGRAVAFKGGRALILELLIAAKPAGIDRAATWQAIANIADVIKALRAKGVIIETRKGRAASYVLTSDVRQIGSAL